MAVIVSRLPRKMKAEVRKMFGLPPPGKFGNEKVKLDGFIFDSLKERDRYLVLLIRQKLGEISNLTVHPRFKLKTDGQKVCTYVADFQYYICQGNIKRSSLVVEDVKGKDPRTGWDTRTPVYKLKKRLMKALLNIDIREI